MATNYDFRILIETVSGSQYSYGTGSFVSLDNTSVIVTTSQSAARIDNLPIMQYYNGKTFTTSSGLFQHKGSSTFANTDIDGSGVDYQFVSCSIVDSNESGSLKFSINETLSAEGDYTKRYKFFGNKVCSVLGLPENYWIYSDAFRLSNTASELNYLTGDLLAQSVNVKHNFAISNAGSIETDLPFKHAKDSDRWIKWTDVSGSLPTNDMMLGYSNLNDRYELRMQNKDPFVIDSPNINLTGSATSSGDFLVTKAVDGGDVTLTIINQNTDSGQDKTAGIEFRHGHAHVSLGNKNGPAAKIEAHKADTYSTVTNTRSSDLVFKTAYRNNLSEEMRLTATGKLGIGTDTPGEALEVIGNISASGTIYAAEIFGVDGDQVSPTLLASDTGSFLKNNSAFADSLTGIPTTNEVTFNHITSSGNISASGTCIFNEVGIGTNNPESKLHLYDGAISNNSTTDLLTLEGYNGDVKATPQAIALKFLNSDTNSSATASIRMAVVNDTDYGDNDENASNLIFATTNNTQGNISDKMIITGRGDVGIGNIAPPSELTVQGDISQSGHLYRGPNFPCFHADLNSDITSLTANSYTTIVFTDDDNGNSAYDIGNDYNTSTGIFTAPISGVYTFTTQLTLGSGADTGLDDLAIGFKHIVGGVNNNYRIRRMDLQEMFEKDGTFSGTEAHSFLHTCQLKMTVNDTVEVVYHSDSSNGRWESDQYDYQEDHTQSDKGCYFEGHMITAT